MDAIKQMDLTILSKPQLIAIIYQLISEIEILRTRITDLEEKQKDTQALPLKQTPPSWVKANVKKKKYQKRKARTHAFVRVKDEPTQQIYHAYESCPCCDGPLGKPSVAYTRQLIDIPVASAIITEHVVCKRYCYTCKTRSYPKPTLSHFVIGKQRVGINLMGLIATLREELRLPYAKIQQHLKIFYQLSLSEGEIISLCQRTASWGKQEYETIKQQLLSSPHLHADETGGRENGKNGYFWNFSNQTHQFLLYRTSRGKKVVQEVLGVDGEYYEGVVVSDFYAAYNEYAGFHQRCWVHYLRDIKKLREEYPKDKLLKTWAQDIYRLYKRASAYTGPPAQTPPGIAHELRQQKEQELKRALIALCAPYLGAQTVFSTLNARAMKYVSELFTFIRVAGVPSDNNPAERAVRHLVVSRKISGGTRSAKGSETKAILGSLFGTWRLQKLNPFEQTRSLLLTAACQED